MELFNQISWYFIREWRRYLGSIILLLIIAILQLLPPKLIGILVDYVIKNEKYGIKIFYWIAIILITAIIVYILRYSWRILLFGAAYKLAIELRVTLYSFLSKKNTSFYLKNRTGDLMARATNDIDKVVFAAGEGVLTLADSIITGLSVLIMMISQINWKLTMISLIPMPIMAILITKYGKKLHYAFIKAQNAFSYLNNQTQESLTNIYMIKGFGLENNEIKKFKKIAQKTSKENIEVAKIDAKFDPIIHFNIIISNLLAIISGSYLVWIKSISIGQLTSFIMYLSLMIWPMLALAWMFNIVERGSAAWKRINEITKNEFLITSGSKNINKKYGILKINIINFFYPNNNKLILKNIFIVIKPIQTIGICGPTGAGKTTLLNLIQKNFDIKKGYILYNSKSINDFKIKLWRHKLSVVNQSSFLFSDTIKNNISLGNPHAEKKDIEESAHLANIHEDIVSLPQGYETQVGERGIILSGGQKQRIAIARALLLKREFLILDDALSAVDGENQKIILQNIKKWKKKYHTIIIVSHKLSILNNSDNIIVIKKGKISEYGKHKKLMKYNNWYSKTYNYQKNRLK